MIRSIQPSDIGWLVNLANEFSIEYMNKPVDYTTISKTMKHVVDEGVALRSDTGAIIGIFMHDPYYHERHLVELGWFAKDKSGLSLLREFERIGRDAGVDSIRMTTLHSSPAAANAILIRRGYVDVERAWVLNTGGQ